MWSGPRPSPEEDRDRGLQRLRSWTTACVALAAGLVGVFSILAATTFPGHDTGATPQSTAAAPSVGSDDDQAPAGTQVQTMPQSPPSGFFGSGSGRRSVVSGGS